MWSFGKGWLLVVFIVIILLYLSVVPSKRSDDVVDA